MASDYLLQLDGVKGESLEPSGRDGMPVEEVSFVYGKLSVQSSETSGTDFHFQADASQAADSGYGKWVELNSWTFDQPASNSIGGSKIKVFLCPSDPAPSAPEGSATAFGSFDLV